MDEGTFAAKRFRNRDWLAGSGIALAALVLYILTLAPTVLTADAGEFQFVPWLPGIAHPTGYPLYVLLGWGWTHLLPLGNVAWRMNLLSAVFASATVMVVYGVSRQLLTLTLPKTALPAQIITATATAGTFAVTHTFWSQAIIAEVYALHALFVALILWVALKFSTTKNSRYSKVLALIFGLGLTHHSTTILLLPALLLFFRMTNAPAPQCKSLFEKIRWLAIHALLAVIPILLYLYLPLAASSTPYATIKLSNTQTLTLYHNSVQGFLQHITGTVFSGAVQPDQVGSERFLFARQLMHQQFGWVGIILAVVGLATLWRHRRFDLLVLTGISFLTFVAFNLIYFIGDVFVLFIPPWLIISLWMGIGALAVAHWGAVRFIRHKSATTDKATLGRVKKRLDQNMYRLLVTGISLFFFVVPAILLATQLTELDQSKNSSTAQRWQAILKEPIPKSAILLSNDRNEIMPMWYYQYVDQQRPDLTGLFPLIVTDPAYANVGRVLEQALASQRPVYTIKPMDGLSLKANIEPEGLLYRVTAKTSPPAYFVNTQLPQIVIPNSGQTETLTLTGYDLSSAVVTPGKEITVTLHWKTTQPLSTNYTSYVHIIGADGQRLAQSDHRPGGEFYPSSYWQVDETVRDQHSITIPDTATAGSYTLKAGMYYQPEAGVIAGMGDGLEVGVINVD